MLHHSKRWAIAPSWRTLVAVFREYLPIFQLNKAL
nr:MAG TPA: hypothetical protein [Caudoviricetes sp.]